MSAIKWTVTFQVYRQKGKETPHYDEFKLEVDPDEYVLDGVERIWAFHDTTVCFRHACHHSTCGACGMRINGVEKLSCITQVREVTQNGGRIKVEPLRNFPVISDLAVDMGSLYSRMEVVGAQSVLPVTQAEIERPARSWPEEDRQYIRLSDCIECGLCISACPISNTSSTYLGPAILAGAQQKGMGSAPDLLMLVDCEDGAWRCHSAFECTAVCPSYVDPARRIMELRKQIVFERLSRLFRPNPNKLVVKEANK
jgi:succinate dehydrogenase / fumarate reductase iron-sulfur subunit